MRVRRSGLISGGAVSLAVYESVAIFQILLQLGVVDRVKVAHGNHADDVRAIDNREMPIIALTLGSQRPRRTQVRAPSGGRVKQTW
jgi:hypothetical protein